MEISATKQQLKAIKAENGPVLIVAGAGTGKTYTLTQRIIYLIKEKNIDPTSILALTFTEKAAYEMSERVDKALPISTPEIIISTFHSFCDKILREEAFNIGFSPDFKVLTSSDEIFLIRKHLFEFELDHFVPSGNPTKFIGELVKHISRIQDENISPEKYGEFYKKKSKSLEPDEEKKLKELVSFYKQYSELKKKNNSMSFGDLVYNTLQLLHTNEKLLNKWQKRFEYLLVDEFQDTNFAQYDLIKMLVAANKNPNIMVVADDDQSIYKFRGAAVSNVLEFCKDFEKAERIFLTENRRSVQRILDVSYKMIQNNNPDRLEVQEKINKKLSAVGENLVEYPEPVEYRYYLRGDDEAEGIALEIKDLIKKTDVVDPDKEQLGLTFKPSVRLSDIAILVRAHSHLDMIVPALTRHAIPYQFSGARKLFNEDVVKDLVNFLRVVMDYTNDIAFNGLIASEIWDLTERDFIEVNVYARNKKVSVFEGIENIIEEEPKFNIEKIMKIIELVKESWIMVKSKKKIWEILFKFVNDSGYIKYYSDGDSSETDDVVIDVSSQFENERKLQNISKLFEFIAEYERNNPDSTIYEFLDYIDLTINSGDSPLVDDSDFSTSNAVRLITVHSSKGLEFPVVFMPSLVRGRFPGTKKSDLIPVPEELIREHLSSGDEHEQEERRLFYVGVTRAKYKLYLSSAQAYAEGKRKFRISPFVVEGLKESDIEKQIEKPITYELKFPEVISEVKNYENETREVTSLSFSQIETYETCPRQYWYKYIIRIPSKPSAAISYGNTIHQVMQEFYMRLKNSEPEENLTLESLLELYEKSWIPLGYMDKNHEKKFFTQGQNSLTSFYNNLFDKLTIPLRLEEEFVTKIGDIKIKGKIDRIDQINSENKEIEIVDYKTGTGKAKSKKIDKKGKRQLAIYAKAAEEVFGLKASYFSLLFIDQDIKLTLNAKELEKFEEEMVEEIGNVAMGIKNRDFHATPSVFVCKFCDFKSICKYAKV